MFPLSRSKQDSLLKVVLSINGFFTTIAVILIFYFLARESYLSLEGHSASIMFTGSWYPTEGQFNLMPMIIGTILTTLGAILLAIPLGLYSAMFVTFYCNEKIKWFAKRWIELYAGLPSVIFGFWGLMKLVPLINNFHPPGQSLLAGILILALMVFPILTLNLIASFEMASNKNYLISESLGLNKSTYIWKILLPSVRPQMIAGILLSTGRAIGETMAVLMVCGNIVKVPNSLFAPVRTLTANIALEMSYAMGGHRSALFLSGLVLLLMITVLFVVSNFTLTPKENRYD